MLKKTIVNSHPLERIKIFELVQKITNPYKVLDHYADKLGEL
jgi:hypothetical protein